MSIPDIALKSIKYIYTRIRKIIDFTVNRDHKYGNKGDTLNTLVSE